MGPKRAAASAKKERKLSNPELIDLANEVKSQECLWDLSNENHKKLDAIDSAWAHISSVTGLQGISSGSISSIYFIFCIISFNFS